MDEVVAPVLHEKALPPEATISVELPEQIIWDGDPAIV